MEQLSIASSKEKLQDYIKKHPDPKKNSQSFGTTGKGSLQNGYLFPFSGANFIYFDTTSYMLGRAFVNNKVRNTAVEAFHLLEESNKDRIFRVMECSYEKGGKFFPHRTHQNGLSIDFMIPLKCNNKPYYKLDSMGIPHYFLDFDNQGNLSSNKDIQVDFEVMASEILAIQTACEKNHIKIAKVILKTSYHSLLFKTESGKKLKLKNIYFAQNLTAELNDSHDEHFHIDFSIK